MLRRHATDQTPRLRIRGRGENRAASLTCDLPVLTDDMRWRSLARPAKIPRARFAEIGRKAAATKCLLNSFSATGCDCEGPLAQFLQHSQLLSYRAGCQLCPIGLFTLDDLGDFKGHESRNCRSKLLLNPFSFTPESGVVLSRSVVLIETLCELNQSVTITCDRVGFHGKKCCHG